MLVYTPQITNRLRYILDILLTDEMGLRYELTTDEIFFINSDEPKLSYSYKHFDNIISIGASGLLFEKGIHPQIIEVFKHENIPVFFETDSEEFTVPFDLFSATFYMVSRYEEYCPFVKDKYGRFTAEQSLQYKYRFLDIPVVDYYALMLRSIILKKYPQMQLKERKYKFKPTYDIDSAYAYLNKGFLRNFGSFFLSIFKGNFDAVKTLLKVVSGNMKDPYDNYDLLHQLHSQYNLKPIYFFLVGDYDEYDKNISIHISEFKTLIKSIADVAEVGIHPSYASNDAPEKMTLEIKRLANILNRDIKKSRQHFLKLHFPITYQRLLANDITDDYSMGFASQPGFRAGYSKPFYFYDLENEMKTTLKIHPFAFMDATFQYYQQITPKHALTFALPIIEELKKVKGNCIILSHNASFFNQKGWEGWTETYETILQKAAVS
jgi:hypothetical protein